MVIEGFGIIIVLLLWGLLILAAGLILYRMLRRRGTRGPGRK